MTSIVSTSAAYKAARAKLGDHRKTFDSVGDALDMLKAIYATEGFPAGFPVVAAGVGLVDVTGDDSIPPLSEWPEAYTSEGTIVCVSFIGQRKLKDEDGKTVNGARGFTVYPLHQLDAIRADETGEAWLWKVSEKEASHVAMRSLRNVPDALGTDALADAARQMPISVNDYVEESTRESLDTSAFDTLWKDFRKLLADSPATAALVPALPGKPEVLKAIRSKPYAESEYPQLESAGTFRFIAETMAGMIDRMRAAAIEAGEEFELDSAELRAWIGQRDTKTFAIPRKVELDVSKVDFSAFMGAQVPASANESDETEVSEASDAEDDEEGEAGDES